MADLLAPILAISPGHQRAIFVYLLLIVVLVVVLIGVALVVRRRILSEDDAVSMAFTLSDLRRLHAQGELSDEEFELARRKMIAQHKALLLDEPQREKFSDRPDKEPNGDAAAGT